MIKSYLSWSFKLLSFCLLEDILISFVLSVTLKLLLSAWLFSPVCLLANSLTYLRIIAFFSPGSNCILHPSTVFLAHFKKLSKCFFLVLSTNFLYFRCLFWTLYFTDLGVLKCFEGLVSFARFVDLISILRGIDKQYARFFNLALIDVLGEFLCETRLGLICGFALVLFEPNH